MMAQIQKKEPKSEEKHPCTCSCHCAAKTFKAGGPFKFIVSGFLFISCILKFIYRSLFMDVQPPSEIDEL
ncbi:transmembrane protein, putative [Medicago truncatula]|uniref:Transmembrane protein, putative n=1 Tax=Medicago truncatula TaxID=3880 RepID=G7LJF8_MEDTR|nr:transmembrane protein, putative [Medicago truncatula]